jgi:hypothetical protein
MHKNAMKCNKTLSKWCKNKYGASKIIDTLETYQPVGSTFTHLFARADVFERNLSVWVGSLEMP